MSMAAEHLYIDGIVLPLLDSEFDHLQALPAEKIHELSCKFMKYDKKCTNML